MDGRPGKAGIAEELRPGEESAAARAPGDDAPDGMRHYQVEPHLFVVLGGTGDLMRRKLLPALRRLAGLGLLGERRALLGVARDAEIDDEGFRRWAQSACEDAGMPDERVAELREARLFYQAMPRGDADDYEALARRVHRIERNLDLPGNRVFYLALPPRVFAEAVEGLAAAGLNRGPGWARLVVEKPFGRDLESARELNRVIHRHFGEDQVYRIDHYLGKETVQNLLVFRFANAIFESLWNRDRVACVQVTVAESIGIGDRADYYDRAGALRDMMQNHVAQLVSLIGMEVPASFDAEAVRYEKVKLLRAISPIEPPHVVLGQYAGGTLDGEAVRPYRAEQGVDPDSGTETFAALRLTIDTWRWQGVPFYVRTGKRLPRRLTQIAVTFRRPPVCLFESMGECEMRPNVLYLTLQPDEGFALCVDIKVPGEPFALRTLPLDFFYRDAFGPVPDAYQTLLLDILTGDQTLFVHGDEAEAAWKLFSPLLVEGEREADGEGRERPRVHPYRAGTWGPDAADALLARDGREWLPPVRHPNRTEET